LPESLDTFGILPLRLLFFYDGKKRSLLLPHTGYDIKFIYYIYYTTLILKSFLLEKKVARYKHGESAIMTKRLKLIMFTHKWGKCVKSVGK